MMTVDEALNHAQNELESAFEKWLSDECPSGDCESVQRQWDESFVHKALVDELQPVMSLTWEVRRLREENERLRKDAERGRYFIERGEWFRHDHGTPDAHALLAIRLPYTADLSCKAMREFAIDAARGAK